MLLQPAEHVSRQFPKIGYRNIVERLEETFHYCLELQYNITNWLIVTILRREDADARYNYHLKLYLVWDPHFRVARLRLMRLDNLLIVCQHDTQTNDVLPQWLPFFLLPFLMLQHILYVIDGLLKYSGLGDLIARGIIALVRRQQVLQGVVALLNGISSLLLSLSVSLSPTLLVAYGWVFIIAILILWTSHVAIITQIINAWSLVLPVLWAEEDGVLTEPVLPQREKVYFSVGLDGSNFMSLSELILLFPVCIVKLAVFMK